MVEEGGHFVEEKVHGDDRVVEMHCRYGRLSAMAAEAAASTDGEVTGRRLAKLCGVWLVNGGGIVTDIPSGGNGGVKLDGRDEALLGEGGREGALRELPPTLSEERKFFCELSPTPASSRLEPLTALASDTHFRASEHQCRVKNYFYLRTVTCHNMFSKDISKYQGNTQSSVGK
jgi:hypothetical protein